MLPIRSILDYYGVNVIKDFDHAVNILCQCPLHKGTGRTPLNFSINRYNGLWRCFSNRECGDGNIISFVMKIEGCSNTEAKRILKSEFKAGEISWKSVLKASEKATIQKNEPTTATGKIPKLRAMPSNHPWLPSRRYDIDTARHFDMKYSPDNLEWVWWPIMFKKKKVGHSSRHVKRDGVDKWYHQFGLPKAKILYNFDQAVKSDLVIVTEGILHVMRLHTFGYLGGVCVFGASPSDEQIGHIIGNWNKVIICLDGDQAGVDGADKLCKELSGHSLDLLTRVTMPYDEDIDDLKIREDFIALCRQGETIEMKKIAPSWGDLFKSGR